MTKRINRAIELLAEGQAIYYVGGHSGHVLTRAQGREDAGAWADYINVGMEHGSFDLAGLAEYMQGLAEGGPTPLRPPHPDYHRRGPGQRRRRRQCPL
jgi:4-hydroxy-2-oxoheptanedioate aldolase